MSVDEIPSIENEEERASKMAFNRDFKDAKEMIRQESGLKEIAKPFRSIAKPKYFSRLIDHCRQLQAERKKSRTALED